MVKKKIKSAAKKSKKVLSKSYHLPMPDNKAGKWLSKKVRAPKPLRRLGNYLRDSFKELKKVNWPKRREALRMMLAIVLFSGFFAAFTVGIDIVFKELIKILFL